MKVFSIQNFIIDPSFNGQFMSVKRFDYGSLHTDIGYSTGIGVSIVNVLLMVQPREAISSNKTIR